MIWTGRDFSFDLTRRVVVVGVLNVTPDSFSDGGKYHDPERAIAHGLALVEQGADVLDIGGESTRPGSKAVDVAEEADRVLPVIEGLRRAVETPLSIDTRKADIARQALDAGAAIVNDVSALVDPNMIQVVKNAAAGLVLMHMRGQPVTMQDEPQYDDLFGEIHDFLAGRLARALDGGIPRERIAIDPGIGFGKTLEHNVSLLNGLGRFADLNVPLFIGPSRKRFIGMITGAPVDDRLPGTLAAVCLAVDRGARIVRVHDVAATAQAASVALAISRAEA